MGFEFFSHIPLDCFSMTDYGCTCIKCNLQFEMADVMEQCIYVIFCCKVWKTTSKTQKSNSVFLVMTQKQSSSRLSGKARPLHI
jgi:hypothetical protein